MLIVFPAMLSLDLKRISANKLDIFCCYSHVKREREAQEDVEGNTGKNNQAFNTDNNTTLNNISMNNINIKLITDPLHAVYHFLSVWVVILTIDWLMVPTHKLS